MKKGKIIIAAVVLLLVFVVGGAIAYFTDTDTVTNTFTIGNVEIEVVEDLWDALTDTDSDGIPDDAEDMMPGETVAKDPAIHNLSSTNSAYVFMKVVAPCSTDASAKELFPYTADTTNWYLMTNGSCTNGTVTRIYAYGTSSAMTPLAASATTEELFTSVQLNTAVDGTETGITGNLDMEIYGYAIQSDGITATTPSAVWTAGNFS